MAQVYWRTGTTDTTTFSLFFRGYPADRGFYAVAGIESTLDYLESFQFTEHDLDYLRSTGIFDPEFVDALGKLRFSGTVRGMKEGTVAFADEPVLEVDAPLVEAQLVETALLNALTFQTTVLTKAVRVKQAAGDRPVVDFGARRAQGPDAADLAARAAVIGGFSGTSNMRAAARFGLTPVGTMAHSFIQAQEDELAAFRAYASEFPETTTLLVDTYDTIDGMRNAIAVGKEMEQQGERLRAVRLDSGDLLELSKRARVMLDEAGLDYVQITASGGLDEYEIARLVDAGAQIDSFGVGTRFVVSADAPYADSAYKLVAYAGRSSQKLSPGKKTLPGPKQVYRSVTREQMSGDVIATADEKPPGGTEALLSVLMEDGRRTGKPESVEMARKRLDSQLQSLPQGTRRLTSPARYPVRVSEQLQELQRKLGQR